MMIAAGVVSSFWFLPWLLDEHAWVYPGDIWATYRDAHWVGWGDLAGVYTSGDGLVTFPGIIVLLAPLAVVTGAFHMSEAYGPFFIAHPSSWFLLGPAIAALATTPLFAIDAVAEHLGTTAWKRTGLSVLSASVLFPVVTLWGHPEDSVALALGLYALLSGFQGRWRKAGWLWGFSLLFQPLTILMWPIGMARCARSERGRFLLYSVLPSSVLLIVPLARHWHDTTNALFHQPNFPTVDHATPWIALSPHMGPQVVGAGPGRMVAFAGAILIGVAAYRRRPTETGLLWMAALAMALRCVFEAVMDPFYLAPPLALILLAAASHRETWRLLGTWGLAMSATLLSYHRDGPWLYWAPMVLFLAAGLAVAWPGRCAFVGGRDHRESNDSFKLERGLKNADLSLVDRDLAGVPNGHP